MSQQIAERFGESGSHLGERKWAERDLNAMYHSLVETLPLSIIRKDLEGRFVFVNAAACEMLEQRKEDVLGKTDAELFEPELAGKYQRDDRHVIETGESLEDVEEFRDPGGELRHVQILKTPVYDSRSAVVGTQVIFWDVTERRRAIEALARNESIKTAMFEAALDCIITIDENDRILEFNPAAAKAFGYNRVEAVGQTMAELLIPEPARERHRANLEKYLGSGVAGSMMLGRLAVPMQRKDGSQFIAELAMQPIPLDNSTGFTVFLRDITERQRAEQELARQRKLIEDTNAELEQEVQVRRRAEEESEMRNRDLKTLLYVISHDLREPLRAVRNFANLIQDRYADKLDEKGQDFLGRIIRGAERLDQQLEDVLMLSRAQRLIDPKEQVALGEVVADVLHQLEMRIQETKAQIRVDEDLPIITADRTWVVQAVFNLVCERSQIHPARRGSRCDGSRVFFQRIKWGAAGPCCRRPRTGHRPGTRRANFRSVSKGRRTGHRRHGSGPGDRPPHRRTPRRTGLVPTAGRRRNRILAGLRRTADFLKRFSKVSQYLITRDIFSHPSPHCIMPERSQRIVETLLITDVSQPGDVLRQAFAASSRLRLQDVIGPSQADQVLINPKSSAARTRPDLLIVDVSRSQPGGVAGSIDLLRRIKSRADLSGIPVVVLGEEADLRELAESAECCRCSVVKKPADPQELGSLAFHLGEYWGTVARFPPKEDGSNPSDEKTREMREPPPVDLKHLLPFSGRPVEILVVDDNNDDATLFQESLAETHHVRVAQILDEGAKRAIVSSPAGPVPRGAVPGFGGVGHSHAAEIGLRAAR